MDLQYTYINKTMFFKSLVNNYLDVNNYEWKYPGYISWNGFNGWVKTIREHFDISEPKAKMALMLNQNPFDWVLEIEDEVLEKVISRLHPFEYRPRADIIEFITKLINKYQHLRVSRNFGTLARLLKFNLYAPKRKVNLAVKIIEIGVDIDDSVIHNFNIFWDRLTFNELITLLVCGYLTPKTIEVFNWCRKLHKTLRGTILHLYGLNTITRKHLNKLNLKYFNPPDIYSVTLEELIKGGLKLKELLPELTKKEASRYFELYKYEAFVPRLSDIIKIKYPEIPEHWIQYIKSLKVAAWANKKINQLSKTRIIYGPGGQRATLHYHMLLREVTDDMLDQGEKTAFRKVMARLEEIAKSKIEAQLGKNVKLPMLPKPAGFDDIVPLDTSHKLRDEGNIMNHCVGGYINACLNKVSYIYHVGDPAPKGATFEVCLKNNKYVVMQIYGYNDSDADARLIDRANEFVNALNEKIINRKEVRC